jgi:hypothetical protein
VALVEHARRMRDLEPPRAAHRVQRGQVVHQPPRAPQLVLVHVREVAVAQHLVSGRQAMHLALV